MRAYGVRGAHWEAKIIFFKIKWFLGMTRCHACCVTPPCIQKSALAAICTSVGSWRPNHLFAGTLWISPPADRFINGVCTDDCVVLWGVRVCM